MARPQPRPRPARDEAAPAEPPTRATAQARYLILFRRDAVDAGLALLHDQLGLRIASTASAAVGHLAPEQVRDAGVLFDRLGVASVALDTDQLRTFDQLPADSPIQIIRQEGVMSALASGPTLASPDYLRGYRDGIDRLVDALTAAAPIQGASLVTLTGGAALDYLRGYRAGVDQLIDGLSSAPAASAPAVPTAPSALEVLFDDDHQTTWGVQATGVAASPYAGRGVAVAILDTGLDTQHADFQGGRVGGTVSCVVGEDAEDHHGHGTACAGIACGPRAPATGPRYGVAYEAQVFAAKVLDRSGTGTETAILAGLNWALARDCRIILLPFGMAPRGPRPEAFYAEVCRRAQRQDALLIAAAGGHSNRALHNLQPIAVPANGAGIVGVGAVDRQLKPANFSNGRVGKAAGSIDLVAPGVNVWTAWSGKMRRRCFSGTSAASAFVAGIAALAAQALSDAHRPCGAMDILNCLLLSADPLAAPSTDVGKGLVKAPPADGKSEIRNSKSETNSKSE